MEITKRRIALKNIMEETCQDTDVEIWRRIPGDYYSNSIHVTKDSGIGINCHGHVIVLPLEKWHELGKKYINPNNNSFIKL